MEFASIDFSHEFLKVLCRHFPKCAQRQELNPKCLPRITIIEIYCKTYLKCLCLLACERPVIARLEVLLANYLTTDVTTVICVAAGFLPFLGFGPCTVTVARQLPILMAINLLPLTLHTFFEKTARLTVEALVFC